MKKQLLMILALLLSGCNQPQIRINEEMVKRMQNYNLSRPSPDVALFIFVKSSDGEMCRLNINELYNIYNALPAKNNYSFKEFVSNSLNQKIPVDSYYLKKNDAIEFIIDPEVQHDHSDCTKLQFIDKYCNKIDGDRFEVKRQYFNSPKLNSVIYFFFINNYKVISNDYAGKYIITK